MQVQRTLVKSPPEIWAEVSDVEALARHLGEFGEIAITRVEPETKVAWEGEHASGTVELTASGWGTKVTLTAEATAAAPDPEPEPQPPPAPPTIERRAPRPEAENLDTRREAAPRRRWWQRWRRPAAVDPTPSPPGPTPGPPAPPAPDPSPPTPTPDPGPPAPPDPNPPQIRFDGEQTEAVLTRVLDDLGQAHHRPFSR